MDVFQEVLEEIAVPDGRALLDGRQGEPVQGDFGKIFHKWLSVSFQLKENAGHRSLGV
jgi:hypothetical protein